MKKNRFANASNIHKPISYLLVTYVLAGISCGLVCGGACVVFAWLSSLCDVTFQENGRLLFLLPLSGLAVVLLYDYFRKNEDLSTDALFRYSHESNDQVSPWLAPFIALSTCLAYLTGGSCGRVGSALQVGGCLGVQLHRLFSRLFAGPASGWSVPCRNVSCRPVSYRNLFLACGMGAGFTAMLNAPVAGALFGVEVLILSGSELLIIIPALISTFTTWFIAGLAGISYTDLHIFMDVSLMPGNPEAAAEAGFADGYTLLKVLIIALAGTLAARLYAYGRTAVTRVFSFIGNKIARVLVGTGLVIVITLLIGESWYNGIGFTYVRQILDGDGDQFAFIWKLLLTTITLGCGIRGGDISPSIFVGATSGFTLGSLMGLDPGTAAAVGIVSTLGSVTKCPVAVFVLGLEMLCCNVNSVICFALASVIAHIFSGTYGIYHQQHSENQLLKPNLR